jgi:hypothetical protein
MIMLQYDHRGQDFRDRYIASAGKVATPAGMGKIPRLDLMRYYSPTGHLFKLT